jgi:hypothetical protein
MSVIEEKEISIEDNNNELDDGEITKTKVKKARTPAQVEAFKEVLKKRQDNIKIRKDEKLIQSAKLLVEKNISISTPQVKTRKVIQQVQEESEDEEIIIVKANPKHKKKTKKIIIEDSSSSDDSSNGSGNGGRYRQPKHQNRVIIQREPVKPAYVNYFV